MSGSTEDTKDSRRQLKCLVTGGAGFLGRHLVDQLVATGRYHVTVLDVRHSSDTRVQTIVGDLRNLNQVKQACSGMDVVFHCASAAVTTSNSANKALMSSVNITGTHNVIEGCVWGGVHRLIYTSTSSVVFQGRDLNNVDETAPYAARPMDYYTQTKIEAEKLVLEANMRGGLATCALRPSGIFGEHDPLFVPSLVGNARKGKMKYIIGKGSNMMEWTYVGNVAQAHIQAAEKLSLQSPIGGQAYFITNDDPQLFWGFIGDLLEGLGYRRPYIHLPLLLVLIIAFILDWIIMPLVRPFTAWSSDLSVTRVNLSACNRQLQCGKAKRDFGYQPKVSVPEAIKRTVTHFERLQAPSNGRSKRTQ